MSKLRDDVKIYQDQLKRAKFVCENYEREVNRLRRETEEQKEPLVLTAKDPNLLQMPDSRNKLNSGRRSNSCQKSRSGSRKPAGRPFKRITKRINKHNKKNKQSQNLNIKQSKRKTKCKYFGHL